MEMSRKYKYKHINHGISNNPVLPKPVQQVYIRTEVSGISLCVLMEKESTRA